MPTKKPTKPISLNEEQQAVVSARSGFFSVYAGPGSGKSACIVARYASLIQEGVNPESILSLSFTASAAKNLRDRVEKLVGKLSINRTAGSITLHSLALNFAQQERHEFNFELAEFPLATEPVCNRVLGKAARRFNIDPKSSGMAISLFKRRRIRPAAAIRSAEATGKAKEIAEALVYKEYDKNLREEGVLDFDSLMFEMVDILDKKPAVRDRWQYQYVMCDEAQDCCLMDWQLLKLVSEKYGNLLCVGDPGQSVFGFRGSDPKLFLSMEDMFPGTQKLYLAANYRSTQELVYFLKTIGPVEELAQKFHTENDHGPDPEIRGFTNSVDEAVWVVSKIKELG